MVISITIIIVILQAEEKAKKTGKGLHDKKNTPTHRVTDMTGKLEKCKQFLPFLRRAGRMQGLVEYVASGSRFRVYIPRWDWSLSRPSP